MVKAFNPSGPFSFPYQDFFTHPKGRLALEPAILLIKIIPPSNFFATSIASSWSFPNTTAESQKSVPFASSIASSIFLYFITEATGPNISSLKDDVSLVTSTKTVAGKKNHFLSNAFHQVVIFAQLATALSTCFSISKTDFLLANG